MVEAANKNPLEDAKILLTELETFHANDAGDRAIRILRRLVKSSVSQKEAAEHAEYICGQWERNQGASSLTIAVRSLLSTLAAVTPASGTDVISIVEKAFSDPVEFRPPFWREDYPALRSPSAMEARQRILAALSGTPAGPVA